MIANEMSKKGSGTFALPGLLKIVRQNKPALPRREVRNPATGEMVRVEVSRKFRVEEYRVPLFEVELADESEIGDTARIRIQSNYFHGGPNAGGADTLGPLPVPGG